MKTRQYKIWSLDVWGNAEDGFNVNDRSEYGIYDFPVTRKTYNKNTSMEFTEVYPTDQQILDTLIRIGYLKDGLKLSDITIDGENDYSLFIEQAEDGFPICELELIKD